MQGSERFTFPAGRMIRGRAVITLKDTYSAQFLLVKLEQSAQESRRNLFCGCHVLLRVCSAPACDHLLKGVGSDLRRAAG